MTTVGFCDTCKLPFDTLVRDEARLCEFEIMHRCATCGHVIIYRSSGRPELSPFRVAQAVVASEPRKPLAARRRLAPIPFTKES